MKKVLLARGKVFKKGNHSDPIQCSVIREFAENVLFCAVIKTEYKTDR